MIQDIFIGVDGGGTKSKLRVEDAAGNLLGQAVAGPANIRLSVDEAWQSVYTALDEVLTPLAISLQDQHFHFHACLALAGCEVTHARQVFLSQPHPFKTLQLTSDARAACVGAHRGNDGAIIIVGTGAVGYQICAGNDVKVSGWGFPHDDEGSGAWLGLQAVSLTFQWLDHRVEKSPLVQDIFDYFNDNVEALSAWASKATSTDFAKLAPLVINHSQQEEIAAVRLMKKAAHEIDRMHHALVKMRSDELAIFPTCMFGGIAPFIEPWLSEELHACLVSRKGDATMGALHLIRQEVAHQATPA